MINNGDMKTELDTYGRIRWTKENGRLLFEMYYTPLETCVQYLRWKQRNEYFQIQEGDFDEEEWIKEKKKSCWTILCCCLL